jgi:hypothetical protein
MIVSMIAEEGRLNVNYSLNDSRGGSLKCMIVSMIPEVITVSNFDTSVIRLQLSNFDT